MNPDEKKQKQREWSLKYYYSHKDECLERNRKWRREHTKERNEINKKSREKNREKINIREAIRRRKIRLELIQLLGGKCIRCGENDWRCLQIDHVNGGGCKEIRENTKDRYLFYLRKVKEGSKDYQLICANCNWRKFYEKNEGIKYASLFT
jgi:hypothetical protein